VHSVPTDSRDQESHLNAIDDALVQLAIGIASGIISGLVLARLSPEAGREPAKQPPEAEDAKRKTSERTQARAGEGLRDEQLYAILGIGAVVLCGLVYEYVHHYGAIQTVVLITLGAVLAFMVTVFAYRSHYGGQALPGTHLLTYHFAVLALAIVSLLFARFPLFWADRLPMSVVQSRLERKGVLGLGTETFFVMAYQALGLILILLVTLLSAYEAFRILARINMYLEARPFRTWSWLSRRPSLGTGGAIVTGVMLLFSIALTSGLLASHLPKYHPASDQKHQTHQRP
jgi:hypothetical protein